MKKSLKVDIIVPIFNEEIGIKNFLIVLENELLKIKDINFNVLLVNDGSEDNTVQRIQEHRFKFNAKMIRFSRNFGHQAAVWAGIESSRQNAFVIILDADLQDHPREIRSIVDAFMNQFEVVLMKRSSREDFWWKKISSTAYYKMQNALSGKNSISQVADFYGLAPKAKQALLNHRESIKYIRGLVTQLGFNLKVIEYNRLQREFGKTHYTVKKMFALAIAGITGFSIVPLLWVVYLGIIGSVLGFALIVYIVFLKFVNEQALVPGWAFATFVNTFFMISILVSLSVISVYLARIVQEQKARPIYIIKNTENLN